MSSRSHRADRQRTRLVLNRETLRTLQLNPGAAQIETPSGQGCPQTKTADIVC